MAEGDAAVLALRGSGSRIDEWGSCRRCPYRPLRICLPADAE